MFTCWVTVNVHETLVGNTRQPGHDCGNVLVCVFAVLEVARVLSVFPCECVQDALFPMMDDDRFEADCLFLVFEEDFRFEDDGSDAPRARTQLVPVSAQVEPSADSGAAGSTDIPSEPSAGSSAAAASTTSARKPKFTKQDTQSRYAGVFYECPRKPAPDEFNGPGLQRLEDMIGMATMAKRIGHGNLIWYAWQPCNPGYQPRSKYAMSSSSGCIGINKMAVQRLRQDMNSHPQLSRPGHWDQCLKGYLAATPTFGGCYIWPPVGGYTSHISGCSYEYLTKPRPSIFNEPWFCPGTRVSQDPQRRNKALCTWTAKARCNWLQEFNETNPDLRWTTFWAGEYPQPQTGDMNWMWAEPSAGPHDAGDEYVPEWKMTKRQKRATRAARNLDKWRVWVTDENEAR